MMIKYLIAFVFFSSAFFAQDDKQENPNVELPDFVITGTSKISIKKVDKIKPDFVTTISEEFLKPSYSPEDLPIGEFSNPMKSDKSFLDETYFYKGNVAAGLGIYTLPTVDMNYAIPFENGIAEGTFKGKFNRAYVDNSDRYNTRIGFNVLYWTNTDANALPGTQFNVNGNYGTDGFKFFASDNPEQKRSLNTGKFEVGIKNDFNKNFLIGLSLINKVANISEEEFKENNLRLKGESLIKFSNFNLGVAVDYRNHSIKNLLGDDSGKDFFLIRPTAGFQFSSLVKGSFGWNFSRGAGNTFNGLYASVAIKLNKNLTAFGEYTPTAEFLSPGEFVVKNNYLRVDSIGSIYWERKNALNASLKYEFDKFFQIDGGFNYFVSDAYPYFESSTDSGKFEIAYADMKSIGFYTNFLFYLGPNGELYSTLKFLDFTDTDGNTIPYTSKFNLQAVYSYRFMPDLKGSFKLDYFSKRYADIKNDVSVGDYFDLGFGLVYSFQPNLDLTLNVKNILNKKNYLWNGYKEIPLNIIVGIDYRL